MKITAYINSSKTLRDHYVGGRTRLAKNFLRDSDLATKSNPVVLMRGCRNVHLQLLIGSAIQSKVIGWDLVRVDSSPNTRPLNDFLTKTGNQAKLSTNLQGLFSVQAGDAKWYVRFIDFEVTRVNAKENQGVDLICDYGKEFVSCQGGVDFEIEVAIKSSDPRSRQEVTVSTIQNWTGLNERIRGIYAKGAGNAAGSKGELWEWMPEGGGSFNDGDEDHKVDHEEPWKAWPFDRTISLRSSGNGVNITTSDLPGVALATFLSGDHSTIVKPYTVSQAKFPNRFFRIEGFRGKDSFVIAVAAVTKDAPNIYTVCSLIRWYTCIDCKFYFDGSTGQIQMKSGTEGNAKFDAHHKLDPPMDVFDAKIEIYGPEATGEDEDRVPQPSEHQWTALN